MRILHTSDWHLGATLEDLPREPDHRQFLDWLLETIRAEKIELLLVSGDVFDSATPSAEAQSLYYRFLHRLQGTGIRQVVVVGGNHDSSARLDAPKELLAAFGIHVVGGIGGPQDLDRCLCPVKDEKDVVQAVVAAVPFVHEWRLGFRSGEGDTKTQMEQLGAPFKRLYSELAERATERWPGVPLIATGHLAVMGSEKDDAPQEIHLIGSLGGLPTGIFDPRYAYVALGHIHRGYRVGGTKAWYCGTPLAMNFKEGRSPRRLNRVDLAEDSTAEVRHIPIPDTRKVLEYSGDLEKVKTDLKGLAWTEPLPPMVKVNIFVDMPRGGIDEEIRTFVETLKPRPVLVDIRQTLVKTLVEGVDPEPVHKRLNDLTPRDVFQMLCAARKVPHDDLRDAFESLLAEEIAE